MMRILWLLMLSLAIVNPAAATEATKKPASDKSVERHEKAYLKKCGTGIVKDCAGMPELKRIANDPARTKTAVDFCGAYNASQANFCGLIDTYPPTSPEIMNAVRQVIEAKKSLMKALEVQASGRP